MENDIIQVKIEDNKLKIEVGIDQLLLAAALGNPGYEINDRKAFLKYLEENFAETKCDEETGLTGLQQLIDDFFDEAYEGGEEWLYSPLLKEIDEEREWE